MLATTKLTFGHQHLSLLALAACECLSPPDRLFLVPAVAPLLEALRSSGARISEQLMAAALKIAGE
jgi:hypothetical protein